MQSIDDKTRFFIIFLSFYLAYCKLFTKFAAVFNNIKFYLMKTSIEELNWFIKNRDLILRALNLSAIYYENSKTEQTMFQKKWKELYVLSLISEV